MEANVNVVIIHLNEKQLRGGVTPPRHTNPSSARSKTNV